MKWSRWALLAAAPLAFVGCGSFGQAMNAHNDQLARAAGKELKVDEAASLLAVNPQIEPSPEMVRTLADRWVDYVLLATALAEDTTLAVLDLDKLVEPERDQIVITRMLDQLPKADTVYTEAELQEAWRTQGPGVEVHARHILLQAPNDATDAQRDSIKRVAEGLRQQAAGGADFAALARQHSQEPGADQSGGDLGFFGRGRMVPQFEEAAFALQPGQISPVVETPFGYHVIKVEERRNRELGAEREQFRQYLVQRSAGENVQKFVDSLTTAANVEIQPGAPDLVKELASDVGMQLRGRAAARKLATWRGGELTAAELLAQLQAVPAEMAQQFAQAPDEQINEVLKNQATREILLAEAGRRRVTLSNAGVDSLRTQARDAVRQLVQATGLGGRRIPKGAAGNQAIEGQVRELLQQAVAGQRQLPPLGPLGTQLRSVYGANVNESVFQRVVEKARQLKALQPQAPQQLPPGAVPQQEAPAPQPQAPQPQAAPAQPESAQG